MARERRVPQTGDVIEPRLAVAPLPSVATSIDETIEQLRRQREFDRFRPTLPVAQRPTIRVAGPAAAPAGREFEEVDVRVGDEILTLRVPKGTPDDVIKRRAQELAARPPQRSEPLRGAGGVRIALRPTTPPDPATTGGLLLAGGEAPAEGRQAVRAGVEALPFPLPSVVAATPSMVGSLGGAPGSLAGEAAAQLTGLAPESPANLVLSAVPFGRGVGLVARGIRGAVRRSPFTRGAVSRIETGQAIEQARRIGSSLRPGVLARDLYAALSRLGVKVHPGQLGFTQRAVRQIEAELRRFEAVTPEGRQLLDALRRVREQVLRRPADFETFSESIAFIGRRIRAFERAGGKRLGGAKRIQEAMFEDLDRLAGLQRTSQAARLVRQAKEAAKLDFAVDRIENQITQAIKPIRGQGGDLALDTTGLLRWFNGVTNPSSRAFDKNFVSALGDEVPKIRAFLERANTITQGSPAGPGAIVVRGSFAATGGILGAALDPTGLIGPGAGAIAGSMAPEMLTFALLHSGSRRALEAALRLEGGRLTQRASQLLFNAFRGALRDPSEAEAGEPVTPPGVQSPAPPTRFGLTLPLFIPPSRFPAPGQERAGPMIPQRLRTPLSGLRIEP